MALIKIIANVDADTTRIDPWEVAEALGFDTTQDIYGVEIEGRAAEVNFVEAEWVK